MARDGYCVCGKIESDARVGIEGVLLDAPDDADDGDPFAVGIEPAEGDALAERIFVRPIFLRHVLVDDRGARILLRILVVEKSPSAQRNFHGFEIIARQQCAGRH